jgi:hypothetical protein
MRKVVHYDHIYSCTKFGKIWTHGSFLFIFYKLESNLILKNQSEYWKMSKRPSPTLQCGPTPLCTSQKPPVLVWPMRPIRRTVAAATAPVSAAPDIAPPPCVSLYPLPQPIVEAKGYFSTSRLTHAPLLQNSATTPLQSANTLTGRQHCYVSSHPATTSLVRHLTPE